MFSEYQRTCRRKGISEFKSLCIPQPGLQRKGEAGTGMRYQDNLPERQGQNYSFQGISEAKGQDTGISGSAGRSLPDKIDAYAGGVPDRKNHCESIGTHPSIRHCDPVLLSDVILS